MRPLANRNAVYQKAILVILGTVFSLALLELGLGLEGRIFSCIQEYKNRASLSRKDSYRILCLGESTTAGQYPHILQEILNQSNIGVNFSVIDKGVIATSTTSILHKTASYLNEHKPDLVVAMMGDNDQEKMYYKDLPVTEATLLENLHLYRLVRLTYRNIREKLKKEGIHDRKINQANLKSEDCPIIIDAPSVATVGLDLKKDLAYVALVCFHRDETIFSQAEELFKKAMIQNPDNSNIYIVLGSLYARYKKITQAEELFKKAIELNPESHVGYVVLGWLYLDQHKLLEAETCLRKAIKLNPKDDNSHYSLGHFFRSQNICPNEAENCFKKAIELNPKNDTAYLALGWLYLDQGQFTQAEEVLKTAIESNPKNDNAYAAVLFLYEKTGRTELAKECARKLKKFTAGYLPATISNYLRLKEILDKRGVRLACVQYPMRSIEPLKDIFRGREGSVIFIDNEKVFKEAVRRDGYKAYFWDMFGGNFGHCTNKGNRLLAENIAQALLKEVFKDRRIRQ